MTAGRRRACALLVAGCPIAVSPEPAGAAQLPAPEPALHLVVPFENARGDTRGYWLSEASSMLLTDDLATLGAASIRREDRLRVFERLRVPPVTPLSHATVIRLGQAVGAAHVVVGGFDLDGDDLTVRARTIRLDTGSISPELVERGPLGDLFAIFGRVARRIVPGSAVPNEQLALAAPPLAAFEQYVKGLLAEAADSKVSFLTQALRLSPAYHRARLALWEVHTDRGSHQEALDAVRPVPDGDPLTRHARFLGATSLLHLGQLQAAFAELSALNTGRDAAVLNNIGVVQLRRPPGASGGKAAAYFAEAAGVDGSDSDVFFNAGYASWLDRDVQGAIQWLREAVRRNPADDAAHYVLGVALQSSGNLVEASRENELARRLSSTYAEWDARPPGGDAVPRGLERLKLGIDVPAWLRVDAALGAASQRDQRAVAAFHLEAGRRLFEEGRDADAIAELRRTVFLAPYDSEAHLLLGRIYLRTGRRQDAIDALTIAAWSDPGNAEVRELLESVR